MYIVMCTEVVAPSIAATICPVRLESGVTYTVTALVPPGPVEPLLDVVEEALEEELPLDAEPDELLEPLADDVLPLDPLDVPAPAPSPPLPERPPPPEVEDPVT
jgi:hypothetical protein